jgi:phosphatidyl-myo-inositol dimannoside synthase
MSRELEILVLTPDFPPAVGGIQMLMHRVVHHAPALRGQVITLGSEGDRDFDRRGRLEVTRVRARSLPHAAAVAALNARGVVRAMSRKPDVVLSGHIATSPAASAIRRLLGVPVVQYLYGHEVGVRPRPTVVTVGRLEDRYKGHDVLVRALPLVRARVPDVRWVVIGDGSLRGPLESLARATGVSDLVHFTGAVGDAERDRWLREAHVFAMPSRLPADGLAGEGFGIVYLEAGLRGLPVVAGAVGGALDAVLDGRTGLLVEPNDHVAVADAIASLLTDRARAEALGRAGAEHARRHAWPNVAERLERLIREVAAAPTVERA